MRSAAIRALGDFAWHPTWILSTTAIAMLSSTAESRARSEPSALEYRVNHSRNARHDLSEFRVRQ